MNAPEDRLHDRFSPMNRHSPARIGRPFRANSDLTRRRDRLHSAVPHCFGGAHGGKKFDQSFRAFNVSRAGHDGG